MHNHIDEIIYVGKAVNLKARVSQYFHHNENRQNRIKQMIASIAYFEVIQVETELEALILESNLIKEYRPRYNAALRKDENHPYLRIDRKVSFPKIEITTENRRDDALYIGPFYKSMDIEQALGFVNKHYGLRTCNKKLDGTKVDRRPCLYFSLGQCMGVCRGDVDPDVYRERLESALDFFRTGDGAKIREHLTGKKLSEFRDIESKLDFSRGQDGESADLFAFAGNEKCGVILLYLIRNKRLSGRDIFLLDLQDKEKQSDSQILKAYVEWFYENSSFIPDQVILTERIANSKALEEKLTARRGRPVQCHCPRAGENGRFVSMTKENARKMLEFYTGKERDE